MIAIHIPSARSECSKLIKQKGERCAETGMFLSRCNSIRGIAGCQHEFSDLDVIPGWTLTADRTGVGSRTIVCESQNETSMTRY